MTPLTWHPTATCSPGEMSVGPNRSGVCQGWTLTPGVAPGPAVEREQVDWPAGCVRRMGQSPLYLTAHAQPCFPSYLQPGPHSVALTQRRRQRLKRGAKGKSAVDQNEKRGFRTCVALPCRPGSPHYGNQCVSFADKEGSSQGPHWNPAATSLASAASSFEAQDEPCVH